MQCRDKNTNILVILLLLCMYFQVFEKMEVSPGKFTEEYADTCNKRRETQRTRQAMPSAKRRRNVLKKEKGILQGAQEALGGDEYESGM